MAAGVPATGIGGIYYILLTIGLLFYKFAKKVWCTFEKQLCALPDNRIRVKKFFPPLAFIICVSLLIFMNVTGFRFGAPGVATATLTIDYLWVIGVFSVSAAIFFVLLVIFRSQRPFIGSN
jgi:hypothetical protein